MCCFCSLYQLVTGKRRQQQYSIRPPCFPKLQLERSQLQYDIILYSEFCLPESVEHTTACKAFHGKWHSADVLMTRFTNPLPVSNFNYTCATHLVMAWRGLPEQVLLTSLLFRRFSKSNPFMKPWNKCAAGLFPSVPPDAVYMLLHRDVSRQVGLWSTLPLS